MFTDQPATPVRLEVLLGLLAKFAGGLKRPAIYDLLQPPPLSDGGQLTGKETLSAALQLELATEESGLVRLGSMYEKRRGVKESILHATDKKVLGSLDVEPHLALFYAYYLGLGKRVYDLTKRTRDEWAQHFNADVFGGRPEGTPFNGERHGGVHRWMSYLGLGCYGPSGDFEAAPFDRVLRALPLIFDRANKLSDRDFMARLAKCCPELDGGMIFMQANAYCGYRVEDKRCSLGVSHVLLELHEREVIRLDCPNDSRGWSIAEADPSRDDSIKSERITQIEFLAR